MMRKAFLETKEQTVVLCLHTGLEICHRVRTTHDRVEHTPNCATDDEMRAEVMQVVRAQDVVIAKLSLDAEVHLLHHRILHGVVDDVNARSAGAPQNKA